MAIVLAVGLVGAGAFAYFSDVEEVGGNVITAGTLNLKVAERGKEGEDPCEIQIVIPNIKPRSGDSLKWDLINTGSLDGKLSVKITNVVNNDNGCNEPEVAAGDKTPGDANGKGGGELGDHLNFKMVITDSGEETFVWWKKPISLNDIVGKGLCEVSGTPGLLKAHETEAVWIKWVLPDKTDNIVQSDSVEFDLIFYLDQVP